MVAAASRWLLSTGLHFCNLHFLIVTGKALAEFGVAVEHGFYLACVVAGLVFCFPNHCSMGRGGMSGGVEGLHKEWLDSCHVRVSASPFFFLQFCLFCCLLLVCAGGLC